ncbi:MAG: histidine kinase dimerization/phosphoacceptor domain -containing protein [Saprospiraceae bacterium]|nr:histidine kinase dimerization/phosphoacceptor domain -containing protein [Saprospiraceae bacterium]
MKSSRLTIFFFLFFQITSLTAQQNTADSLLYLGIEATKAGHVNEATTHFIEAQKLAEAAKDDKLLCRIYIGLGKLGLISENNAAASENIRLAEQSCGACRDTLSLGRVLMQKGIIKIKEGKLEEAIEWFKTSSAFHLTGKDTIGSTNALAKLGNVLERQGRYAEATPYYIELYNKSSTHPNEVRHLTANIYLTANYLYLNQPDKAMFHNDKVKQIARHLGVDFEYAQALRYDALILRSQGQFAQAFDALEHYIFFYQDTLMNKEQLKQAENIKAQYESEKKENQIALQKEELKVQNLRFWALLTGLVLALIGGGILFFLARRLRQRNREKEFLIKEIHHRVKNNLQILSSLLHLQSRQITDHTALDAVREGQNRVDAMGLIHQKLYMGDHVARVEMRAYLDQLARNMLDSFGINDGRVRIETQLDELFLDVDTAIPLGLIINELLTNSLKYAFPGERSGVIVVALEKGEKGRLQLRVSDNGIGQDANAQTESGFGANLVKMLSKKLKGRVESSSGPDGFRTDIQFG